MGEEEGLAVASVLMMSLDLVLLTCSIEDGDWGDLHAQ